MRLRTTTTVLAAATALAALTAAPSLARQDSAPSARAAKTTTVKFGEYFYSPRKITVSSGDTVRFLNVGKIEHTVADSTRSGSVRSRIIKPRPLKHGQSQRVTFKRRGTVYYICTFHPTMMRGVITVR